MHSKGIAYMLPGKLRKEETSPFQIFEVIDASELGRRWHVPVTWIREQTRARATDPLPCVRLGRYVRFEWGAPSLVRWFERRRSE
jgi:hypothetical protein